MRVLFYGDCGAPQSPILCALRREDVFDSLTQPAPTGCVLFYEPQGGGEGTETNLKAGLRV